MIIANIAKPYLLMVGDMEIRPNAKTALGLRDWVPDACLGQFRYSAKAVDLGLPDMSLRQAVAAGAKTLVIGIAPWGGQLPGSWHATLFEALEAGLDIAAGLHQRIAHIPGMAERATKLGRKIFDVRHCDANFTVASGKPRTGKRLLTVGTDCSIGKKYTALKIADALGRTGVSVDFRATGQTGILISGQGIAIDAVVADFIAGAAEVLSPDNDPDHWDIIEGQGSLFHPAYAGVTLGLLHGSQPDALVLCHNPTRATLNGYPHVPVISPEAALPAYVSLARLTNPHARFVGVSLDTSMLDEGGARHALARLSRALDLPCVDPLRSGVDEIVEVLRTFDAR